MELFNFVFPVIYALFLWWFTTGLIMAIYGRSQQTVQRSFIGATIVMLTAIVGIIATRQITQPIGVYLAVTCGTILWGWHTASYYLGFITGPKVPSLLPVEQHLIQQVGLFSRFKQAFRASLYHELLVLGFALLIATLTWSQVNQWGLWSFLALWSMHVSAKLNVFFGVRNFRMEFLPAHMHLLGRLLTKRAINPFFPFSVISASVVALLMLQLAFLPETAPAQTTGLLLVGVMILLGVFEHWLLVLPLPATLWGWGSRSLPQPELPPLDEPELDAFRRSNASMRTLPEQAIEG